VSQFNARPRRLAFLTPRRPSSRAFRHNVTGAIKGAAVAASIVTPAWFFLQRQSANFRAIPLPLKAFGIVTVAVPCITIGAEKAGEKYERGILGVNQIEDEQTAREEARWEKLSTGEKVRDWGKRYQWSIVGGRCVQVFAQPLSRSSAVLTAEFESPTVGWEQWPLPGSSSAEAPTCPSRKRYVYITLQPLPSQPTNTPRPLTPRSSSKPE